MQGRGKLIPSARFVAGPGGSWPRPVFWAGSGPEENFFCGPISAQYTFGPRLAQYNFLGRDRPSTPLGRDRPMYIFGPISAHHGFGAESGPVVWAGPARFNIIIYIYIIFCIIIYIYIYMKKIIKICKNYRKIYVILL